MPGQIDSVRIAKSIEQEVATFDSIMWAALAQKTANPKRRTEMITAAFSNLKDFMAKTLAAAPAEKIVRPGGTTAGKKERQMTVTEKLQHDIAQTKARIEKLKADSPFFQQGGGQLLDPISYQDLVGNPASTTAAANDLPTALATLRESVEGLLTELDALETGAGVQKGVAPAKPAGPWDGVFSRNRERRDAVTQLCKAEHAARVAKASQGNKGLWDGVWSGRA